MTTRNPNGGSSDATITLSDGARAQAQWALLDELRKMCAEAVEEVAELRDFGLERWPQASDARTHFRQIADAVEALDALGWREYIAQEKAQRGVL